MNASLFAKKAVQDQVCVIVKLKYSVCIWNLNMCCDNCWWSSVTHFPDLLLLLWWIVGSCPSYARPRLVVRYYSTLRSSLNDIRLRFCLDERFLWQRWLKFFHWEGIEITVTSFMNFERMVIFFAVRTFISASFGKVLKILFVFSRPDSSNTCSPRRQLPSTTSGCTSSATSISNTWSPSSTTEAQTRFVIWLRFRKWRL